MSFTSSRKPGIASRSSLLTFRQRVSFPTSTALLRAMPVLTSLSKSHVLA
jgi:hypothetical protein